MVGNDELLQRMPALVEAERRCSADVIEHLVQIDMRRIYLDAACTSLSSYCMERLAYSEDEAAVRVRVTRLAMRLPQVLEELRGCRIHLSGLAALGQYLTAENADDLLKEARWKTKRNIEEIIARRFPKPDVPERMNREADQLTAPTLGAPSSEIRSGPGTKIASGSDGQVNRVRPLSESRWSVQFTAGEALRQKIEHAKELLSHALPNGELATLFERALDALIERETKRRFGAGKPRQQREPRRTRATFRSRSRDGFGSAMVASARGSTRRAAAAVHAGS